MRIVLESAGNEYRVASDRKIRMPEEAANAAKEIASSDTECFCVLSLDARNGLRASEVVTTGLVDSSLVHPREVFRAAIGHNACAVVLVHNHPTGDTTPSAEDIRITRQLIDAGKIIDIKVIDHVIIGAGADGGGVKWSSLRDAGLVEF